MYKIKFSSQLHTLSPEMFTWLVPSDHFPQPDICSNSLCATDTVNLHHLLQTDTVCLDCLTLILLTWRKWWAPNNASKQQMGFNSAFKGL